MVHLVDASDQPSLITFAAEGYARLTRRRLPRWFGSTAPAWQTDIAAQFNRDPGTSGMYSSER
jgi:hypothetical protein